MNHRKNPRINLINWFGRELYQNYGVMREEK